LYGLPDPEADTTVVKEIPDKELLQQLIAAEVKRQLSEIFKSV